MKIGKYYVSTTPDNGIMRPNEQGELVECAGYYCNIFDDPDCENFIDDFCLALGHEIPDTSDESIEKGIRWFMTTYFNVEEEHQKEVDETTDMITAEDIVEQTVYAANAPDCCADKHAENILGMLGANIIEPEIYHSEDECPNHEKTEPDDYKQAVREIVEKEFADFKTEMTDGKTPQEVFYQSRRIFIMSEMHDSICNSMEYDDEVYKALYQERGHILKSLHSEFEELDDMCLGTPGDAAEFIENYCNENHADIMQGEDDQCFAMGGIS